MRKNGERITKEYGLNCQGRLKVHGYRLVQDGDGLRIVTAADQSLHVVIQHSQTELQDRFDAIKEKTVHHIHSALYG